MSGSRFVEHLRALRDSWYDSLSSKDPEIIFYTEFPGHPHKGVLPTTLPTTFLLISPVLSAPAFGPHNWVQHSILRCSEFIGEISIDLCYFHILTEEKILSSQVIQTGLFSKMSVYLLTLI